MDNKALRKEWAVLASSVLPSGAGHVQSVSWQEVKANPIGDDQKKYNITTELFFTRNGGRRAHLLRPAWLPPFSLPQAAPPARPRHASRAPQGLGQNLQGHAGVQPVRCQPSPPPSPLLLSPALPPRSCSISMRGRECICPGPHLPPPPAVWSLYLGPARAAQWTLT